MLSLAATTETIGGLPTAIPALLTFTPRHTMTMPADVPHDEPVSALTEHTGPHDVQSEFPAAQPRFEEQQ